MSFAYDLCTYLSLNHAVWDSSAIEDGFNLDIDVLSVSDFSLCGIYLNQVPADRTDALCVYDTGGYEAFRMYGKSKKEFENPTAQIRVRNHLLRVAEDTAYKIYSFLDDLWNVDMNGCWYFRINAQNPPCYIGEDQVTIAGTSFEYSINVYAKLRRGIADNR